MTLVHSPFSDPASDIVTMHVTLAGIKPSVYWVFELPLWLNFAQLHEVMQAAFGWTDSHLHRFEVGCLSIGASELLDEYASEPATIEATEIQIRHLDFTQRAKKEVRCCYVYDFGDNWRHDLVLQRYAPKEVGIRPRCVDGARSGPPEDVGGPSGYENLFDNLNDPEHEDYASTKRWVGRKFDPEFFDLDKVNKAIAKSLRAARGDYGFRRREEVQMRLDQRRAAGRQTVGSRGGAQRRC